MEKEDLKLNSFQLRILRNTMDEFFRKGDDAKLRQIFTMFDRNKNGNIEAIELKSVMEQIVQSRFTDEDIRQMMEEADSNGNGKIEYPEFCEIMMRYRH